MVTKPSGCPVSVRQDGETSGARGLAVVSVRYQ